MFEMFSCTDPTARRHDAPSLKGHIEEIGAFIPRQAVHTSLLSGQKVFLTTQEKTRARTYHLFCQRSVKNTLVGNEMLLQYPEWTASLDE